MEQVKFGAGNLGNMPKYDITTYLFYQGNNQFGNGCLVARELPVGQGTPLVTFNSPAGLETVSVAYFTWLELVKGTFVKKATRLYAEPLKTWNAVVTTWHTTSDSSAQGLPSDFEYVLTEFGTFANEPTRIPQGHGTKLAGPPDIWPWHFTPHG